MRLPPSPLAHHRGTHYVVRVNLANTTLSCAARPSPLRGHSRVLLLLCFGISVLRRQPTGHQLGIPVLDEIRRGGVQRDVVPFLLLRPPPPASSLLLLSYLSSILPVKRNIFTYLDTFFIKAGLLWTYFWVNKNFVLY